MHCFWQVDWPLGHASSPDSFCSPNRRILSSFDFKKFPSVVSVAAESKPDLKGLTP